MQRVTSLITNQHIERLEVLCDQLSQAITITAYYPVERTRAVDCLMLAGDWLYDYNAGVINIAQWEHIMKTGFEAIIDCLLAVREAA